MDSGSVRPEAYTIFGVFRSRGGISEKFIEEIDEELYCINIC
jgi:hypothetical protein